MDNLLSEGKQICAIFESLINSDEFDIVRAILQCKFCLEEHNKKHLNGDLDKDLYERCEKYLEESKKYVSPEYVNKYLK